MFDRTGIRRDKKKILRATNDQKLWRTIFVQDVKGHGIQKMHICIYIYIPAHTFLHVTREIST